MVVVVCGSCGGSNEGGSFWRVDVDQPRQKGLHTSDNDRDGQSCHLNVAPLVFCMENGEWRMEMGEKGQRTVQIV